MSLSVSGFTPKTQHIVPIRFGETHAQKLAAAQNSADLATLLASVLPATASIEVNTQITLKPGEIDRVTRNLDVGRLRKRLIGMERIWNRFKKPPQLTPQEKTDALQEIKDTSEIPYGSGSGFWIRCADGKPRLLTNYHVIEELEKPATRKDILETDIGNLRGTFGPETVKAALNSVKDVQHTLSGKTPDFLPMQLATRPGTDEPALDRDKDLALLEPVDDSFYQVKDGRYELPNGAPPVSFDDELADNKPGHKVFKIGNSDDGQGNIAHGIISDFSIMESCPCPEPHIGNGIGLMLGNTASINPGDSGGPLLNMLGKVVGINQSKSAALNVDNIGYSIASTEAQELLKDWGFLA